MNERFQWVEGPMTVNVSINKIVLHHYVLKSEEVRKPCPASWHAQISAATRCIRQGRQGLAAAWRRAGHPSAVLAHPAVACC